MSFTKKTNNQLERPARKYIEWNSTAESFRYWDKDAKENVNVDLSGGFIVLDNDLLSVTGFSDPHNSGIYSNEVRTIFDKLDVKIFAKPKPIDLASGTYMEIKEKVKSSGGKYTRCLYILLNGEIVHVKLAGAGFFHWPDMIESKPSSLFQERYVVMTGTTKEKKGSNSYKAPTFDFGDELSPEDVEEAISADTIVQKFLDEYLEKNEKSTEKSANSDTSNWREYEVAGEPLGGISLDDLKSMQSSFERDEVYDEDYDMVCAAIHAKQEPKKSTTLRPKGEQEHEDWGDYKTPKGKSLSQCDLDELKEMRDFFDKNPSDKHTNLIGAISEGIEYHINEDDIPF